MSLFSFLRASALVVALAPVSVACGGRHIAGTAIDDNSANREVVALVQQYVAAAEKLDPDAVLELVSQGFYETRGTSKTDDDYGYDQLAERLRKDYARLTALRMDWEIRAVSIEGDRAQADYYYQVRFEYKMPWEEKRWDTREDVERMELRREDDRWKIVGGL